MHAHHVDYLLRSSDDKNRTKSHEQHCLMPTCTAPGLVIGVGSGGPGGARAPPNFSTGGHGGAIKLK